MWFRSAKEFKENIESKAILVVTAWYTTYTYINFEDSLNQHERGQFIDEWLMEPVYNKKFKLVPVVSQVDINEFN